MARGSVNIMDLQHIKQRIDDHKGAMVQRRQRMQTEEARYTLVLHSARKELGISIHEYCLADTVHKLSGSRSPVPGWCYASKEQMGKTLGFSRQSIHSMILTLKKQGLIEIQEGTGYLRSTDLWRDTVAI